MTVEFERVYRDVQAWAESQGIRVNRRRLPARKAGEFDGLSATMNSEYESEEASYYLAHALGSMVRWYLSRQTVQAIFDELRDAKKGGDSLRLERAIDRYRAFEVESSEFAIALLAELGHAAVISSYTNFMRADLESLTEFHRYGKAPVWRAFFARWNGEAAGGERRVEPFTPKPIPKFRPTRTEKQEIIQEQGEGE